jgi:ribonuclease P protein component
MLPKSHRLQKKTDFDRVYKKGKRLKFGSLLIGYLPNNFSCLRLGFVVSKKISNKATRRNYLKRVMRATFSDLLKETNLSYDVIVSLLVDPSQSDRIQKTENSSLKVKARTYQEFQRSKAQFTVALKAGR